MNNLIINFAVLKLPRSFYFNKDFETSKNLHPLLLSRRIPPYSQGLGRGLLWRFKGHGFGFQKHRHLSAPPSAQKVCFQPLALLALAGAQALRCGRQPRAGAEAPASLPTGAAGGRWCGRCPSTPPPGPLASRLADRRLSPWAPPERAGLISGACEDFGLSAFRVFPMNPSFHGSLSPAESRAQWLLLKPAKSPLHLPSHSVTARTEAP